MSYSTSNYLAEQQQSIQLLTSKLYGFPVTGAVTPYVSTDFVTAELFNLRNKELDGLLSYLEDTRRDETTRASLAEQALDSKYTDVAKALGGYKGIVTVFQGTTNFLDPDYQLVLSSGNAFSEGNLLSLPSTHYAVTFTAGANQKLILTSAGELLVKPEAYVVASTEQLVGVWNGSTNNYTPEPKATSVSLGSTNISAGSGLTKTGTIISALAENNTISVNSSGISIGANSITNAEINSSAAIADTKLAAISTPGKILDSALSANIARLDASQTFLGTTTLNSAIINSLTLTSLNVTTNNAGTGQVAVFRNTNSSGTGVVVQLSGIEPTYSGGVTLASISGIKVGSYSSALGAGTSNYKSALTFAVAKQSAMTSEVARFTDTGALLLNSTTDNAVDKLQVTGSANFTGKVKVSASTSNSASLLIPPGSDPTTPVNGDIWTTSAGVFARINNVTVQLGGSTTSNYEIVTETATGLVNSTDGSDGNGTFTVSAVILNTPAPKVYISGAFLLIEGTHYTWVGNTISILAGYKPISSAAGSEYILVEYAKGII